MSNIYEQKARKYKYKYLKLKQQYIGGGGEDEQCKSIILTDELKKLNVTKSGFKNYCNDKYIGELVNKYDLFSMKKQFKIVKKYDLNLNYIPELVFSSKIKNSWLFLPNYYKEDNKTIINTHFGEKCLQKYIAISKNVGKTFEEHFKLGTKDSNIVLILKSLKESIKNFIIPLYTDGYVLRSCDENHMLINNNKVYFYYLLIEKNDHEGKIIVDNPNVDQRKREIYDETYSSDRVNMENPRVITVYYKYNVRNSDVFGLCNIIKYLYNKFNIQLPQILNNLINSVIIFKNEMINGKEVLEKLLLIL
jgi:hypothetical protein